MWFTSLKRLLKRTAAPAILKQVIEMIFTCDNCSFIFSRNTETEQCPDCGKYMVRPADAAEQDEFTARMAELIREECAEAPWFPNLVETEISMLSTFSFRLPATALQIDSQMIVDIIVEYGESSADRNELIGNVWARQEGGLTTSFLMTVHLPAKQGELPKEQVNRVFSALNNNDPFKVKLYDFITEQQKRRDCEGKEVCRHEKSEDYDSSNDL